MRANVLATIVGLLTYAVSFAIVFGAYLGGTLLTWWRLGLRIPADLWFVHALLLLVVFLGPAVLGVLASARFSTTRWPSAIVVLVALAFSAVVAYGTIMNSLADY